ncbi:MAG TPA: MJ0042-type zinc finger domain-containing protein [Xanthobacteraceae bacterium]|nr:MJ0042-type zinc finger domain-containing protein [Xanthobacteraceae bacterium]
MNIVCPHCTTFFAIDPAKLGPNGRTVRCARCKQVWLARPELPEAGGAAVPAFASAGTAAAHDDHDAVEWHEPAAPALDVPSEPPVIDSPSIAAGLPSDADDDIHIQHAAVESPRFAAGPRKPWLRWRPRRAAGPRRPLLTLPIACIVMAALAACVVMWRAEIVRLLPQTARFYSLIGLNVNLRGLDIRDVKISTETVESKPVLVIEGNVVGVARRTVEVPRLRFVVRDAKGAEIYAWNAVLEQTSVKPGERAGFRSRLAAPPPEGREVEVRFFNQHDLAAGGV